MSSPSFFSWSGGKDSMLALHQAREGGFDVRALLVMMDETGNRSRSHALSPSLLQAQAASLGIPVKLVSSTWESYERNFIKCLEGFAAQGITHGIFGDIDLQHHREWEEKVCAAAGLQAYLPLWQQDRQKLARLFIDLGYKAVVACVNAHYLDVTFAGRLFDAGFLEDLPPGVDACGENGEFHTFVTAGPGFAHPLDITVREVYSRETVSAQGAHTYHYARLE